MSERQVRKPSLYRQKFPFITNFKFHLELPKIPAEQKLLAYPFEPDRYTKFKMTSLQAKSKPTILLPLNMGIHIDLINPDVYENLNNEKINTKDLILLEEPEKEQKAQQLKYTLSTSQYLRKSTMAAGPLTYANKQIINTNNYDDDSDIDAETLKPKIIEAFEKKEFKHPRKPELKPVKVYDVIPEKGFIHKEFTVFNFYEHPYNLDQEGFLKEYDDEEGEQILSLYCKPRKRPHNEISEVSYVRNYKTLQNSEFGQNDILLWQNEEDSTFSYALLEQKMMLKKKKVPKGLLNSVSENLPPKKLSLQLRDMKRDELLLQKEKQLDCEMAVDEDLSDGILDAMDDTEDIEQVTKKQVIARLFGDDSDEEF